MSNAVLMAGKIHRRSLIGPREMAIRRTLAERQTSGHRQKQEREGDEELQFEEAAAPALQELGLHRDGVMPIGPPSDRPRIS